LSTADPVLIAKEHEQIVEALEAGNRKKATSLLVWHDKRLIEQLQQRVVADENSEQT